MTRSRNLLLAGVAVAALILTSCSSGASTGGATKSKDAPLESLSVRLNFTPWAMHNYLYAALDNGFFKARGLDVKILPAQAGQSLQFVGSGQEEVGVTDASAMLSAVQAGAPLVAIAMDQPVSPGAFFYLADSGIKTPKDLEGKKVCYPTNSNIHASLLAGLQNKNVDINKINFVSIAAGSEVSLVAAGECDVSEGFSYGQPLTLEGQGIKAGTISVDDLGVDLYGVVLFTNKKTLKDEHDKLVRFMEAVSEGQIWAYQNMTAATTATLTHAEGRTVPNEIKKAKLIYKEYPENKEFSKRWGAMTAQTWKSTIDELVSMGSLDKKLNPSDVFTNSIVDASEATVKFATLFHKSPPSM